VRVALVTGSSRGLGAAIARRLATAGLAVAVNGRDVDAVELVVGGIVAAGGTAAACAGDITDDVAVGELVQACEQSLGPVDTLVLNATGPQPGAAIADVAWEDHVAQLDFFVRSPVLLGAAIIPGMIECGFGRIVLIGSDVADRPPPGSSAYATAKSAQIGLARAWAVELAAYGITVNTVAPGFIPVERHHEVSAEDIKRYVAGVPTGRMGLPADVAAAVALFVGDDAGFITGQRIVVDGGRHLSN
jgi:3-oxoacyl-[acyl-carrier protein] reductase